MRFVIFSSGLFIASAIKQANGITGPLDEDVRHILAWVLIVAAIMDITEWLSNILRSDNGKEKA